MTSREFVTIETGGKVWSAFERVQVRAALNEAARTFSLEVAFEPGPAATAAVFKAGNPVTISSNGDRLVVGYVDRYRPVISATRAQASISGRSKAADAIDGAAIHKTGRFENKSLLDIAQELDKAKVGFESVAQLDKIAKAQLRPGETVFGFLERYARQQNVTLTGTAEGKINFYDAKNPKRHAGALQQGANLVQLEVDHDWSKRHSHYVVRGQKAVGTAVEQLEIEAVARDNAVERWRPIVIVEQKDTDDDRAKKRSKHHRDRSAGRSLSASATVQGFRDDAGQLWEPGRLIYVESAAGDIAADMLIETVDFTQDASGSLAVLSLVDPRAYNGKKGRGGKSGQEWSQDDDDAVATPPGGDNPKLEEGG